MALQLISETTPHGKLLLTGEYSVLDGALALALPTRLGQAFKMYLNPLHTGTLLWKAHDHQSNCWMEVLFSTSNLNIIDTTDQEKAVMLQRLLLTARALHPGFLRAMHKIEVHSTAHFPRDWGLGTSSTLVAAVAHWAGVSPYALLRDTFGGSGYDLACAYAGAPVLFQKKDDQQNSIKWTNFRPNFSENMHFVYLGNKQNSREGIAQYRSRDFDRAALAHQITAITQEVLAARSLEKFNQCMLRHEQLLGEALGIVPIQKRLFGDFDGVVKSLGAWGGDFVLAASHLQSDVVKDYFTQRGFGTVIAYGDMV